jgi:kynurenine formamidase
VPPARTSVASAAAAPDRLAGRWIDLTHPFDESTIYWPTEKGFALERGGAGVTPKGYYYAANRFAAAEHGGTHIDAPIHFHVDRHTVDEIELERLMGEALVVDATTQCAVDPDYEIGVADLRAWEIAQRRPLAGGIVLLRTGWSRRWADRRAYLGTDATGPAAVAELRFPGLAPEAARWLVEQRRPLAVGIDTASIDRGRSERFESHVALCGANVPIFENVDQLDALPAVGAQVVALPMKIGGGSGAPLRIVALVPDAPSR